MAQELARPTVMPGIPKPQEHVAAPAPVEGGIDARLADLIPPKGLSGLTPRCKEIVQIANKALACLSTLEAHGRRHILPASFPNEITIAKTARELMREEPPAPDEGQQYVFFESTNTQTLRNSLKEVLNQLRRQGGFFGSFEDSGLASDLCNLKLRGRPMKDDMVKKIWTSLLCRGALPQELMDVQMAKTGISHWLSLKDFRRFPILATATTGAAGAIILSNTANTSLPLQTIFAFTSLLVINSCRKAINSLSIRHSVLRLIKRAESAERAPCMENLYTRDAQSFIDRQLTEDHTKISDSSRRILNDMVKALHLRRLYAVPTSDKQLVEMFQRSFKPDAKNEHMLHLLALAGDFSPDLMNSIQEATVVEKLMKQAALRRARCLAVEHYRALTMPQ